MFRRPRISDGLIKRERLDDSSLFFCFVSFLLAQSVCSMGLKVALIQEDV